MFAFCFLGGLALGGCLVWLWLRTRIAELTAEAQAGDRFQSLADTALRSSQSAFLEAARGTLETVRAQMSGDLAQKQIAIEGVVKPLSESLGRLESQVRQMELARQSVFGSLGQQIQSLARETDVLSRALKSPQARGRWGEITLRRVAELSGMVRNCDFEEQTTFSSDGIRIRPDMIVRLPGGRCLVVDAKVPLTAYLDAVNATDDAARKSALMRHAQQVTEHVKALSAKQYWMQFQPAPELVVLFLPGEHFFSAALEQREDLIEQALASKVLIATPVTLISILKGVAYGWSEQQLAENAEKIRAVAAEFHGRIATFYENYSSTGQALERAVDSFNRSVGSWESRVLPSLRKVNELGIGAEKALAEPERIDKVPRRPRAVGE